jgi:8-oxo-dGTP diphosphatase
VRVVAAAIVRDGRVLAARRSQPPALAGGWEFPGGKVEHGESDEDALVRECAEELGARITVGALVGAASDGRIDLVLHVATLAGGEPMAGADHDELSWVAPDELDAVAWLPIDRQLVPAVVALLRERRG